MFVHLGVRGIDFYDQFYRRLFLQNIDLSLITSIASSATSRQTSRIGHFTYITYKETKRTGSYLY